MRILVCGGRSYGSRQTEDFGEVVVQEEVNTLNAVLNDLLKTHKDVTIIQGEAKGADRLAKLWAIKNKVPYLSFPANWSQYGKSAGYKRNVQMLEEGKPDLVVAFSGGKGTAMMCDIATRAGVEVIKV